MFVATYQENKPITKKAKSTTAKSEVKRPMGRQKGAHLKDMSIEDMASELSCARIILENPWLSKVKLFENTLMGKFVIKADDKTASINLSPKFIKDIKPEAQRGMLVDALCHLVAVKEFDDAGNGKAFQKIKARYSAKDSEKPITGLVDVLLPQSISLTN